MDEMEKQGKAGAVEGGRRPTGAAPAGAREGGRFSAARKREAVLRLLRGESLEAVSRDFGVTAARLASWRDDFVLAGEVALRSRGGDSHEEKLKLLQAKIGELTMENELLRERGDRLQAGLPLAQRRRRR